MSSWSRSAHVPSVHYRRGGREAILAKRRKPLGDGKQSGVRRVQVDGQETLRAGGGVTVAAKDLDHRGADAVVGQHRDVEVAVAVEVCDRQEAGIAERGVG